MPRYEATTLNDFARSRRENTRGTLDDVLVLAGVNEAPNPDFDDPVPGEPFAARGHILGAPEAYDGWGVAIRQTSSVGAGGGRVPERDTRLTVQNPAPLSFTRNWRQDGPLVDGSPPNPSDLPLYRLTRPAVVLEEQAMVGYGAGFVGVAYRGIAGALGDGPARLFTDPSPRAVVELSQGQCYFFYPGQVSAEGLVGFEVLQTDPQPTLLQAQTATLHGQRIVDLRREVPPFLRQVGPMRRDRRAFSGNETFIGASGEHPGPGVRRRKAESGTLEAMDVRVSYQVRRYGNPAWSAVQRYSRLKVDEARPKEAAWIYLPPKRVPKGTFEWRAVLERASGEVIAFEALRPDEECRVHSADPEKYSERRRPEAVEERDTDATGVPGPDSPPEDPQAFGAAKLAPGEYVARVFGTLTDDETGETREGPLSDFAVVTLPEAAPAGSGVSSKTFIVQTPDQNLAFNPRYVESDPDGRDKGWDLAQLAGVSYERPQPGVLIITDRSNSTANAFARLSRWSWDVDPTIPYTVLVPLTILDYTGGRVNAVAQYRDATDAVLSSQILDGTSTLGKLRVFKSFGPAGSGADFAWPADTRKIRFFLQLVGSNSGARNLKVRKGPLAITPGLAAPELTDAEDEAGDLPNPQGYCRVLPEVDCERVLPAELRGRDVRVIEYYAPLSTRSSPNHGPRGLKIHVAPGVAYATTIHLWHRGITKQMNGLVTVIKNKRGETLLTNPPLAPARIGSSGWARHQILFTAPPDAAYLEFVSGGFSDGLVRVAALQHEEGGTPTPYDNTNPIAGSVAAILDTEAYASSGEASQRGVPGAPSFVRNPITRWIRAGSIHTNTANTFVSTLFSGGDTALEADSDTADMVEAIDDMGAPGYAAYPRYLKIRDALTTTDATESPEVDSLYLEAERRYPVLTRMNGSDFPGGVKVGNLPPPDRDPGTVEEEMASGVVRTREMRPENRMLRGLELLCYRKSARTEVSSYAKRARRAGVEGDGMRYVVEIPGEISWDFDRGGFAPMHKPDGTLDPDGWYVFRATVDAWIVSESAL